MGICRAALEKKFSDLDSLFQYFRPIPSDEKLKSHIAKYMTMLVYASFESGIKELLCSHIERTTSNKSISNHLQGVIRNNYRNIDFKQLFYYVNMIDDCGEYFENKYRGTSAISSFDSIVGDRQAIAHGGQCTITFDNIEEYYNLSKPLLLELVDVLDSR